MIQESNLTENESSVETSLARQAIWGNPDDISRAKFWQISKNKKANVFMI